MRLSELFPGECVLRDAEFDALGLSNTELDKRLLSFLEDARFAGELNANKNIIAVICPESVVESLNERITGVVIAERPRKAYFELHNRLALTSEYWQPMEDIKIGQNCKISNFAVIDSKGVVLGDNITVEEFVVIKGPCVIGDNTIIKAGAKIGGEGFEFKRFPDSVLDVTHCGPVIIGRNVIIWENTTIHRAVYPWDTTSIGDYVRISANAHIDHGAKIESFAEICAGAIVSGRTVIGDHALVGPGAIVSNRISVGNSAKVSLGGVVTRNVAERQTVSGNFAIEHSKHMENIKKLASNTAAE